MRKILLLCTCLISALFTACEDESGEYIEQLSTDAQLTSGIRECLNVSKDTAVMHLCIADAMCTSETHRISLPSNTDFYNIANVLTANGHEALLDTLENHVNRACEQMGDPVVSTFKPVIDAMTFSTPSSLVNGADDAITSYFKANYATTLQASLSSSFAQKMRSTGASDLWNEILVEYYEANAQVISYDLQSYVLQQFLNEIFEQMSAEEKLIRNDSSHRVSSILQTVFGDIGEGNN
ncbi:MAG: DUF4197 domain-containing protein [Bacteroidales bacterium]|nr:DUF4197 domain-containing protein [Bacteroidales bacterium]